MLHKPHGVRGEMSATFEAADAFDPAELRCIVLTVDGIPVPFFIEGARRRGTEAWLVKLQDVDDEASAAALSRHEVYALRDDLPPELTDDADGMYLSDLVGYTAVNADGNVPAGVIDDIDDSTANTLLIIRRPDGRRALVPYSDDLLCGFDPDARTLTLAIPPGVLDLNNP